MTVRRISPAKFRGPDVPTSQEYPPAEGETFPQGAPVHVNSGAVEEVTGLDTGDEIAGFASEGATAGVPDGIGNTIVVHKAEANTEFIAQVWGGDAVDPTLDGIAIGDEYQLTKEDDEWLVNGDAIANPVVRISKLLPELGAVLFTVIHRHEV